jgi:hypothetical protein
MVATATATGRTSIDMDMHLLRQLNLLPDAEPEAKSEGVPGRSTLTSKLAPAPQIIFRVGHRARFNGHIYRAIQQSQGVAGQEPDRTPALWQLIL